MSGRHRLSTTGIKIPGKSVVVDHFIDLRLSVFVCHDFLLLRPSSTSRGQDKRAFRTDECGHEGPVLA